MRKIILGILIGVFSLLLIVQTTSTTEAETNPENFECLETLTEHSDFVISVAFSKNNEWLASSSNDKTIKIWDTSDWSCIETLSGHSEGISSVVFSQNNEWLASGSWDSTIKIWNTTDWSCIETLTEHSHWVESVSFSQNNEWLASGSYDEKIKIWNTSDWSCIETLTGHIGSVRSLAFSSNNEWLASGSFTEIKIWNTSDWSEIKTLTEHTDNVRSVTFSQNNEWLASGSDDDTIKIWNTSDWSCIETLTDHSSYVMSVVFSPNNKWLASGSYDDTIKIWDTSDWSCIETLTEHTHNVNDVAFSPNNEWLASCSFDDTIKIWGEKEQDWVVTAQEIRTNETIILKGNLIIENGGNLTFKNVTLKMNCKSDGEYGIVVNDGGKFDIYDYDNNPKTKYDRSNITANNKEYEFKFLVDSGAEFEMRNSELSECGYEWGEDGRYGLTIKTNNIIIENSSIYNNNGGIYFSSARNNRIKNNNISKNYGRGIRLQFSNNNQITNNTIHSNDYYGISLWGSSNNQITNNRVSNNVYGIYLEEYSNDNQITNNSVSNNHNGINLYYLSNNNQLTNNNVYNNYYGINLNQDSNNNQLTNNDVYSNNKNGIRLTLSSNNLITNNNVSNNGDGIRFYSSNNITMKNNILNNNEYNFGVSGSDISDYYHDIDTSNTINGKPIYYISNQSSILFDNSMDIGYLGLISCSKVTIKNLSLSNNVQGILFMDTTDSVIENCEISIIDMGIHLFDSSNNQITNNNISNNDDGIYLRSSSNNQIRNNSFSNNNRGFHFLSSSNNNQIINNTVSNNNNYGLYLQGSENNQIINNSFSKNNQGIHIAYVTSINNQIINNTVSNNEYGIYLDYSKYNQIINNDISISNYAIKLNFSHNNQIINSTISNSSEYDFYLDGNSDIIAINTTFNKGKVNFHDEDSELTVKWYLHVKVVHKDNLPIPNTRVIVENLIGEEIYNDITGLDGWTKWIVCKEYIQTKDDLTFYTNHTINIEDNGYLLNTKIINMNESKYLVIQPKPYNVFIECDEPIGYTNPGELTVYEIGIINKGLENDMIYLEIDNPSNWLAYLNSYFVILSSNEEKVVYLTVRPGKDEIEGKTSTINMKGTSNGNVSTYDLFQVETTVNFVHSIEITQSLLEGNNDPGEGLKYEIQLENLGNGDEEIYLRKNNSQSDEIGEWIINELVPLEIEIGKSGITSVTITPPSNATANEQKKFVFDILSEDNDIYLGSFTTITTVNQTHEIEIKCDKNEESGNPSEIITYLLIITNNGNGEETYYLELSGENIDWCDLSDTYISLNYNNYTEIYLNVSIPNNAKAWEKANITINVLSLDRTEKYNSINIITNVYQLFDLKIETENKEIFIEPGIDFEFDVTIENLGNGVDDITLSISGIPEDWIIEPKTINTKIDSKSSITKSIKITIPENALVSEIANLGFTIKSDNNGDVLDYLNLTVYVNQNIEIEFKCSNPKKEVIIGESLEYKIEVKNKGNGKDTIILELSGLNKNWAYISESVVVLEAGKSKNISLFVKSPSDAIEGEKAIINIIGISKNKNYSIPLTITTTLKAGDYKPPKADFKILLNDKEVTKVRIGELVTFDALSTSDEKTEIAEYRWDFDNGDIRYGEKVEYTYPKDTEPGEYTITLRVTDSNGITTEKQMTIDVIEEEEEKNWFLYLILIILVVIGILIVIMLQKVVKNLRNLGKVEKPAMPSAEKVRVPSLDEGRRKEEQKRKEMEMWKPVEKIEEKPEPLIKIEEEKIEEIEEKVEEIEEGKTGGVEEIKEEKKENVEEKEKEENTINEKIVDDDFWKKKNKDLKNTEEKKEAEK